MSFPEQARRRQILPALVVVCLCASCTRMGFEPDPPNASDATVVTADHALPVDALPVDALPVDAPPADASPVDAPPPDAPVVMMDHWIDQASAPEAGYAPPVISSLVFKQACIPQQRTVTISVQATDPADPTGGALIVAWSSSAKGSFTGAGGSVSYTPSQASYTCNHDITAKVTSGKTKLSTTMTNTLKVTLLGDLNQDGIVNMVDQSLQSAHFAASGCCNPSAPCRVADLDKDCDVDAVDLGLLTGNWLQSGCSCP